MADQQPRVVASFDSYEGMLEAIRRRVNELAVGSECLETYLGIPKGYYSKIAGVRPIRRLGMQSFQAVISGLGLRCWFVEDPEATQRLKNRVPPRNSSFVRAAPSIILTARYFQKIGRKGALARIDNSTAAQRRKWARKAAIARWKNGT